MAHNNPIDPSVFATSVPSEVAEPHGRSSFAPIEEVGDPIHDKELKIYGVGSESPVAGSEFPVAGSESPVAEGERHLDDPNYPRPTEEERTTLRRVADKIPAASFVLCAVEFAERASYYGVTQVWANFMQFPLPARGNGAGATPKGTQETAGALGRGLQFANAFTLLFTFLAYVIPIFGAWIADTRLGRYKTIALGVIICGISHVIIIFGALPSVLKAGHGIAPFMISYFILAFGAGIFKPNIAPTVLDQYTRQREFTKTLRSGEKVLVDPETTIQRMMLIFYGLINVGAFFALATTYSEKYVGYWLAFLLPGILYFLLPILLYFWYNKTIKKAPSRSAYDKFYTIIWIALKKNFWRLGRKGFWNPARPSVMRAQGITTYKGKPISWDDGLVDDVHRTFSACQIFLYFIVYNLNDGGTGSVGSAQAATMTTNGAPNDLLSNFNPLTIIVAIPLLSYVIYPLLHRYNIKFGRISRITFGFTLAWISGIYGAVLQYKIYKTSPCGYNATSCSNNGIVSPLNVWLQIPNVALGALSECFCNVTAYELAYARSPKNMKALVIALFLLTNALSSALGEIVTPAIIDPHLIWVWAGPAIAMAVLTVHFYWRFHFMDNDEFMTEQNQTFITGNIGAGKAGAGVSGEDAQAPVDEEKNVQELNANVPQREVNGEAINEAK